MPFFASWVGGVREGSLQIYILIYHLYLYITKVEARLLIQLGGFSSNGVLTGKQILVIVSLHDLLITDFCSQC